MIIYKVYSKDYRLKKGKLLGILSERRNDLREESYFESGLKWARLMFGPFLKDKQSLFVVPHKLEDKVATRDLMEMEVKPSGHEKRLLGTDDRPTRSAFLSACEAGHSAPTNPSSEAYLKDASETFSYEKYYGFSEKPFELVSDHKVFYFSASHRNALAFIIHGIANQVGYITLTGEAGTGKTALIYFLLLSLRKIVTSVVISNTPFDITELIRSILLELGVGTVKENEEEVRTQLHEYLLHKSSKNKNVVVVLDDAQDLSLGVLRELGKLLKEEKKLQVIFVGRCELEEKLQVQGGAKVYKGKGVRCRIRTLNQKESKRYIDYRLRLVGSRSSIVFTPKAVSAIVGYAGGIPRLINIICTHAFLLGCAQGNRKMDRDVISEAIKEVREGNLLAFLRQHYSTGAQSRERDLK